LKILLHVLLLTVAAIACLGIAMVCYMVVMPSTSYRAALPPLKSEEILLSAKLKAHVLAVATEEHNVVHYDKLDAAARYIERTLSEYGYTVRRQEFDSEAGKVRNLEVTLSNHPEKRLPGVILVGAHYDSARDAIGANDNATGVAAVLELARLLKQIKLPEDRELRLVLYVNEEPPYFKTAQMGSWVHAADLAAHGQKVLAMLSLETMGYYSDKPGSQHYPFPFNFLYPDQGNFIGFIGAVESRALVRKSVAAFRENAHFPSEGIAAPAFIHGIDWSDHWAYREFGYPALMVTDTAPFRYPYYHTEADTADKIDFDRLARVVGGLEAVVRELVVTR